MKNFIFIMLAFFSVNSVAADKSLSQEETDKIVRTVDDRQKNSGDYKTLAFVKETERNKEPRLYQAVVYRRDTDDKFMILFTKPKEEAGKSYLKIDKNLWNFDPSTGKWERRTEREKLAGTNSRRSDFDESRLAIEYTAKYEGEGTLGKFKAHKIRLTVREGVDVAYPVISLWVDKDTNNVLKREELALSGKLMRTTFYPVWSKKHSASKKADVWFPEEMRVFDELEKGNSTIIQLKEVDLNPLQENIFTKAWIESKSR